MRRIFAAAVACAALVLGACENDAGDSGGGASLGFSPRHECRQFTSCGTCTPVDGCGWCFDSDGNGLCAASPDECVTPVFSWTWNPSGCRVPADAGTAPVAIELPAPRTGNDGGTLDVDAGILEMDGDVVDDAATPRALPVP